MQRIRRPIFHTFKMLVILAVPVPALAGDQVVLQLPNSSSRITVTCTILDYTGESIKLKLRSRSAARTYPASQVAEVRTEQSEAHRRGLKHFSEGRLSEAAASLQTALEQEARRWVRREILATLLRCSLQQGDYATAGSRFLMLLDSDPETRHFKLVPLVWASGDLPESLKTQARGWLVSPRQAARLMGASVLLTDPDYSSMAESELHELATDAERRIRQLAETQLWRKRLQSADISHRELDLWRSRIETIHEDLRGGPYYVLGKGHALTQEYERAAAAFLWLPLVYDADVPLAARACLEAAHALRRIGQQDAAVKLYREVAKRFDQTPFAQEAKEMIPNRPVDGEP